LKKREETKEHRSEDRPSSSNDLEVDVASEGKGENSIFSNSNNSNSASSLVLMKEQSLLPPALNNSRKSQE
jgi:hypothetical protein